jgi:hypothetical protein
MPSEDSRTLLESAVRVVLRVEQSNRVREMRVPFCCRWQYQKVKIKFSAQRSAERMARRHPNVAAVLLHESVAIL